jgi:hypothetical protein
VAPQAQGSKLSKENLQKIKFLHIEILKAFLSQANDTYLSSVKKHTLAEKKLSHDKRLNRVYRMSRWNAPLGRQTAISYESVRSAHSSQLTEHVQERGCRHDRACVGGTVDMVGGMQRLFAEGRCSITDKRDLVAEFHSEFGCGFYAGVS